MKYAILFWLLAAALSTLAVMQQGLLWLQILSAVAAVQFALVGLVYFAGAPRLFGKTASGQRRIIAWLPFGLFFLLSRCTLELYRRTNRRQAPVAEVTPGLWFARRLTAPEAEALPAKLAGVLDLAGEFPKAPLESEAYQTLPLLDGLPVSDADLRVALDWLAEHTPRGPVLVHCALGHGRTGSIILAWLLSRGEIADLAAGVARLQELRPGFGISAAQLARVGQFVSQHCST